MNLLPKTEIKHLLTVLERADLKEGFLGKCMRVLLEPRKLSVWQVSTILL